MKYYIRMWDCDVQKYLYLIDILAPDLSRWSKNEGHSRVLFDTIKDAQQAIVDHRWSKTEIMDYEEVTS